MFNEFLSLFLKSNCPLCERSAKNILCSYCREKLQSCQLSQPYFSLSSDFFLFAWGKYDSYLKRAIAQLKYDKKKEIGELMGNWLGEKWLQMGKKREYPSLIITPIPLHKEKLKMRGFNQAELIASGFCDVTGYSLKPNLLSRVKNTSAMFSLKKEEREGNMKEAFELGKDYKTVKSSAQILIIDDIYTTGATVKEAKQKLKQGKLTVIGVAVVSTGVSFSPSTSVNFNCEL